MPERSSHDRGDEPGAPELAPSERLDSWKEIAAYFRRDIRTLHRWEKTEGLPVHRHRHSRAGTVYAFKAELDAWWNDRRLRLVTEEERTPVRTQSWKVPVVLGTLLLIGVVLAWVYVIPARSPVKPLYVPGRLLANATAERATIPMIAVGTAPEYAAATPDGTEIYVANRESGTVSVINTATNSVTHTIRVGGTPRVIAIAQAGSRVYVCNNVGSLSVIETSTKTVNTIPTDGPLLDLVLAPDAKRAFMTQGYRGLKELLLRGNQVTVIPTVAAPVHVAFSADGTRLYVNYQASGPGGRTGHDAIDILDVPSGRFIGNLSGPPNVGGYIVASPDGRQIWADGLDACRASAYDHEGCPFVPGSVINVIRASDNKFIRTLGFADDEGGYISFFPNGSRAVVGGRRIKVIDTETFELVETHALYGVGRIAFTPDGRRAYAPVGERNAVAVFDLTAKSCLPPPHGLAAWWPGDGNTNDIRGANDGQIRGGAGFAPGRVGQAFRLDGADGFVNLGDLSSLVGSLTEFSVAAWAKFNPVTQPHEMAILDRTDHRGHRYADGGWRLFKNSEGQIVFCIGKDLDKEGCRGDSTVAASRTIVGPGNWVHLAAIKTSREIALYLNGAVEATAILLPSGFPSTSELRIGSTVLGGAFLDGLVDEVQWYNRALRSDEIKSIFAAGSSGLCYGVGPP